jgi:hypothetical protein
MDTFNSQRGATLIGWLFIVSFIILMGVGVMRLYPVYYDHFTVKASLKSLATDSSIKSSNLKQIQEKLLRHFSVNNVQDVDAKNLEMEKKAGKITLILKYEVRVPFMYNIDFAVSFDDSVVVN